MKVKIAPHWNWNSLILLSTVPPLKVKIAPHWNWNGNTKLSPVTPCWSKSHHTGIEIKNFALHWSIQKIGQNRTTLELKCAPDLLLKGLHPVKIAPHWNWNGLPLARHFLFVFGQNRTTLELKSKHVSKTMTNVFVKIAPHWNWNLTSLAKSLPPSSQNRTTLELKSRTVRFWY